MRPQPKIDHRGKDAIFARPFKCVARMERSVIRDCHEASMPPRISLRSIQATLASLVMPALVAGIHVFVVRGKPKTWMAGTSPVMTVGDASRHVHSSRSAVLS
jgi:hypothetical protein